MSNESDKAGTGADTGKTGRGRPGAARRRKSRRGWLTLLVLAVVVGGGAAAYYGYVAPADDGPQYRFAHIEKGTIVSTVSTSGTLKALVTVQVGSQLSGQIKELNADFNSIVKKGQVLARLDTAELEAKLAEAKANLEAAKASLSMQRAQLEKGHSEVVNARSQVERAKVSLADAKRELGRKSQLAARGIVTRSDADKAKTAADLAEAALDSAEAQLRSAEATLKVTQAQIESAAATVAQRQAAVRLVEVDLERSVIRSPIDGVVVERTVDVGQTVAASLQAPTLFTIAGSLKQMEVHASVDEADVGRIVVGQSATFTVGAFPRRQFTGTVKQVRLAPKEEQNVVTYTVVISANNPRDLLLPGMTAEVRIVSEERKMALKVPNAALRFRPLGANNRGAQSQVNASSAVSLRGGRSVTPQQITDRIAAALKLTPEQKTQTLAIITEMRAETAKVLQARVGREVRVQRLRAIRLAASKRLAAILNDDQRKTLTSLRRLRARREWGQVYTVDANGKPKAIRVRVGVTDGTFTEIRGSDLKEGQVIIIGASRATGSRSNGSSRRPRLGF